MTALVDMCKYMCMPIEQLREEFTWGTYGINGDQPLQRIKLKQMSDDHIRAIIRDGYLAASVVQRELIYRSEISNG